MKNKGILPQIKDSNSVDYSKLSNDDISELLKRLISSRHKPKRNMVFYTGLRGMYMFNFVQRFGNSFYGNWWIDRGKNLKPEVLYLSVIRKCSLYKVKVIFVDNRYKFFLYKGTTVESFHYNISSLNSRLRDLHFDQKIKDCYTDYNRDLKILNRELEGKLRVIHKNKSDE